MYDHLITSCEPQSAKTQHQTRPARRADALGTAAAAGMAPLAARAASLARRAAFAATALALSAAAGAATAAGLAVLFLLSPRAFLRRTHWAALELPPATAAPLAHEFVETEPGVVIHVARTGGGGGKEKKPLLLLLHGFPVSAASPLIQPSERENNNLKENNILK